jgi:Family of unknown function (DUF6459)
VTAAMVGPAEERRTGRPYLAPVPDTDPPFDPPDSGPVITPARRLRRVNVQPTPSAFVATGSTAVLSPSAAAQMSVACDAVPSWSVDPDVGVRRTATAQLPPARRAAQILATALLEALSGRRPVAQLRVHTAPAVYAGLVNRSTQGFGRPAQLMSVRVCQPADGVGEANATVRGAQRVHAIAFRIEGVDGRWRITALDIG